MRTQPTGRFADRYVVPDDVRTHLHGWVMCTVVVQPRLRGAGDHVTVVRWQRASSSELVAGLNALLASLSVDVARVRASGHHS